jgi:signal transduction histidine kinase
LQELAASVQKLFHIECRFECLTPVPIQNNAAATHLYRIAQEAINNAIKHGKAGRVVISLKPSGDRVVLTVVDDGLGISGELKGNTGIGLRIMKYRADMVGATLEVRRANGHGTVVACSFSKDL